MAHSWLRRKLFPFRIVPLHSQPSNTAGPEVEDDPKTWIYKGPNQDKAADMVGAFRSGNKRFFMFRSEMNIPVMRCAGAIDIYREVDYGISITEIRYLIAALKGLASPKQYISEADKSAKLAHVAFMMEERLNLTTSLTLAFSLATIRYFDETEDINGYDIAFNNEKKRFWMQNHDVPDFFLNLPVTSFITSLEGLQASLSDFLKGEAVLIKSNLKILKSSIELSDPNSDLMKSLTTQISTLESLIDWSKGEFMNTTFTSMPSKST